VTILNMRVSAVHRRPYIVAVTLLCLLLIAALWAWWRFDHMDRKAHRLGHSGVAIVRLTEATRPTRAITGTRSARSDRCESSNDSWIFARSCNNSVGLSDQPPITCWSARRLTDHNI